MKTQLPQNFGQLKFIRQLQSCDFFLLVTFTININYDWYNPDKGGRLWCAPTPTISYGIRHLFIFEYLILTPTKINLKIIENSLGQRQ